MLAPTKEPVDLIDKIRQTHATVKDADSKQKRGGRISAVKRLIRQLPVEVQQEVWRSLDEPDYTIEELEKNGSTELQGETIIHSEEPKPKPKKKKFGQKECPKCGDEVHAARKECHCGHVFYEQKATSRRSLNAQAIDDWREEEQNKFVEDIAFARIRHLRAPFHSVVKKALANQQKDRRKEIIIESRTDVPDSLLNRVQEKLREWRTKAHQPPKIEMREPSEHEVLTRLASLDTETIINHLRIPPGELLKSVDSTLLIAHVLKNLQKYADTFQENVALAVATAMDGKVDQLQQSVRQIQKQVEEIPSSKNLVAKKITVVGLENEESEKLENQFKRDIGSNRLKLTAIHKNRHDKGAIPRDQDVIIFMGANRNTLVAVANQKCNKVIQHQGGFGTPLYALIEKLL